MTTHSATPVDQELLLAGLDGSNPLAFLAALGTLRALSMAWPEHEVRMSWVEHAGAWRPVLLADAVLEENAVIGQLNARLKMMSDHPALAFADDLKVTPEEFRALALRVVADAHGGSTADDRIGVDFAAAFACDALGSVEDKKSVVQDTALRTMSGSGHQHFLKVMREIVARTGEEHLRKALFAPWAYDDPVKNQSLRWDPNDDSRYAYRWSDPSGDRARERRGGMLGANRLAIEALPMVTSAPSGSTLRTVGFTGTGARNTFWTWPIWTCPISRDACCSLLAHPSLVGEPPNARVLRAIGVATAFQSQRITIQKYRNFTPARAVF